MASVAENTGEEQENQTIWSQSSDIGNEALDEIEQKRKPLVVTLAPSLCWGANVTTRATNKQYALFSCYCLLVNLLTCAHSPRKAG